MSVAINSAGALGAINPGCWKRKDSDDEEENNTNVLQPNKRSRISYYVTLESESPVPTDEDEESIYSVQGNETEFVRDTSDTSTHSWNSSSDEDGSTFHIEYEVAPLSDQEISYLHHESSSDPEDLIAVGVLAAICDSDVGLADDSDDSRTSVDSEIGKADYWTCVQCHAANNNPLFRYCERCYKERKNFFPPRPKRKRRRSRRQEAKKAVTTSEDKQSEQSEELMSLDSGLGLSQESKFSLGLDLRLNNAPGSSGDSEVLTPTNSQLSFCTENTVSESSQKLSQRPDSSQSLELMEFLRTDDTPVNSFENSEKLCVICTLSPKNGVFVHGGISHICCCYKCAIKVWKMNNKRCPICKRKVSQVLKAFYI